MPKFSHLHVHTQYSLLDGAASISGLYEKAIKDEMPALAITDHGNMFGAFNFVSQAWKKTKVNKNSCEYLEIIILITLLNKIVNSEKLKKKDLCELGFEEGEKHKRHTVH